jgi:hypothetical protein
MKKSGLRGLRSIEGRQVSVALRDGSRLDDRHLVSGGRTGAASLWLVTNGHDEFVALSDVIDVWETHTHRPEAA